jgi:hypothetical protein
MQSGLKAIETTGTIDSGNRLVLDDPLPVEGPTRVRLIILFQEEAEMDETQWLQAASSNPAFDFMKDPGEDIYTLADGRPFCDQG